MSSDSIVLVVGQIGRDLVLRIDRMPPVGGAEPVAERAELLGGKGANQAVGLRQLDAEVAILGVVGEDDAAERVLGEARASGIDVSHVRRRGTTALLVDVVEADGNRLLEHVPESSLLTVADIEAAAAAFVRADTVCLQLQQPTEALLVAAELARRSGARVVLDGAARGPDRDSLLAHADVVRADAVETEILTGVKPQRPEDAEDAARSLLAAGASVVALGVSGTGDLVAWDDGSRFYPFPDVAVVDKTGGGDAFVAALVMALRAGATPEAAGAAAADAAASTVQRLGGRPDLRGPGGRPDLRGR
jgi:ribokinase